MDLKRKLLVDENLKDSGNNQGGEVPAQHFAKGVLKIPEPFSSLVTKENSRGRESQG
jgi:hypothetical protein